MPFTTPWRSSEPPPFDDADRDFARKIRATLSKQEIASVYRAIGQPKTDAPLADFLTPLDSPRKPMIGSTDIGDVSWVVPPFRHTRRR